LVHGLAEVNHPQNDAPGRQSAAGLVVAAKAKTDRITYFRPLWSQRRFLLRTGLSGLILSLLVAVLFPVSYESETRLMPPHESNSALAVIAAMAIGRGDATTDQPLSGSASIAAGDAADGEASSGNAPGGGFSRMGSPVVGSQASGALILDALGGPTVEDELIRKFDLRRRYHVRYTDEARAILEKRTKITEDRKSGVISIRVSDHDPYRAQQMAAAYPEALNALLVRVSSSSARRERIFLEQRLKDIRTSLDAASQEFARFAGQSGTADVPAQFKVAFESEARLEAELGVAESELKALEQTYTDSNIRVRKLQASVASLRGQVESFVGREDDPASLPPDTAGGSPPLLKLGKLGPRWANLYRAFRTQDALYKTLTREYELAKIQEAREIPAVKVLDRAPLPERTSFPPRLILTVLGSFLSLGLAGVVAISAALPKHRESPESRLAREIWEHLRSESGRLRARLRQAAGGFSAGISAHGGQG